MSRTESVVNKLERGRAELAYKCVKVETEDLKDEEKKKYRSYSRKIPTMILTNGLGQTLAFIKSKSEKGNAYSLIYDQLTEYMKSDSTLKIQMPSGESDLVKWVISSDSVTYRYIEQEILAFLNWLKRFAEGLIEEEG